jgi:hypothetical protein
VNQSVHELAEAVQGNSNSIDGGHVGLGSERVGVVDRVGTGDTRDGPVEEAVLEYVLPGHCVGGKLVDEESLVLALDEVQHDHGESDPLGLGHVAVSIAVQNGAGCNEKGMEEEGTQVLDDEDGSPRDLVTHILDEDLASCDYGRLIDEASLAVLEGLLGSGIIDTNTVVVTELGLLCDKHLEILDGGVGLDLNRLWKVLDGLLRSCIVLITRLNSSDVLGGLKRTAVGDGKSP